MDIMHRFLVMVMFVICILKGITDFSVLFFVLGHSSTESFDL